MSAVSAFIKDYGPAGAWVVAAVGWLVANKQANKREVRKEVRAEIDDIARIGKGILTELQKYYATDTGSDAALLSELTIKASFKELDLRFDRLHSRGLAEFPVGGLVAANEPREAFFDLATGVHFETSSRPAAAERSNLIVRQTNACLQLTEALHAQFLREFDGVPSAHS